ncbi:CbiX/SirB N-terminal domain-containing protein [Nocardioides zeae]|uniref:CbiX/SirB N-terminal domain-containing protein n=1 Tax=Nocardioides imazamoxiresistens TaxID=3231893 RepID=A0ABU3PVJ2_9ACTN|nr:CbiX/SirB N-terminal domain-containing protein [Nocardioides zeae]MDT9593243.1 CbiX/SirB N-terminal domain-containing protein [Nocardioides zeae]
MSAAAPTLVTVAHGTRDGSGSPVARALTAAAAERTGMRAVAAYVELAEPLLTDVLAAARGPVVVVPLLLSSGLHVDSDVPEAVRSAPVPARLAGALGPSPLLADAMCARLREAGATPGGPVTMVAAGSRRPGSLDDLAATAHMLGSLWGSPVRVATLSGLGERPEDVVRPGDAVVPYLLAPGFFARRCSDAARAAGAEVVADVIGAHAAVVELVAHRARLAGLLRGDRTPGPSPAAA